MITSHYPPFFIHNVFKSITSNAVKAGEEIFKIMVVTALLRTFSQLSFPYNRQAQGRIVFSSVVEELLFRGLVQKVLIQGIQTICNNRSARPPLPENYQVQKIIRIALTAILFGAVPHFIMNISKHSWVWVVEQCVSATLGGVYLSTMMENTNSLAMTIFSHGIDNYLLFSALLGKKIGIVLVAPKLLYGYISPFLGYTSLEEKLCNLNKIHIKFNDNNK